MTASRLAPAPARDRKGPRRAPALEPEPWSSFVARAAARLAAHTDISLGPDGCWTWLGSVNDDGYGRVVIGYRFFLAHRLALALKVGRLLRRNEVSRHQCIGNRLCVNPAHLLPGSIAQNNRDMAVQDRVAHGERSGTVKLTADQVAEIRRRAPDMAHGRYEQLGREYGVTGRQIAYICGAERWRRSATGGLR